MDGLAREQLLLSDKLQTYLDHCLTCRSCEVVCPANVPYGQLIDHGRALIATKTAKNKWMKLLNFTLLHPSYLRIFYSLLRLYQFSGLQKLVRKTSLLKNTVKRLDTLLPILAKRPRFCAYYPPQTKEQGKVALFTGCMGNFFDATTLQNAIKLLTRCGYGVYVPPQQRCCGALSLHAGYSQVAEKLAHHNLVTFNIPGISAIITTASGCSAVLQNTILATPVLDICEFLLRINWQKTAQLKALPKKVALHTPCTLRNVLHQHQAVIELLQCIPEIELMQLQDKSSCCGAAGLYFAKHPDMADQLLDTLLQQLKPLPPEFLVTSNIGCALHWAQALGKKASKITVLHPITLLAEALDT
jgi:glycolate oxidase iron-sulfur subunit